MDRGASVGLSSSGGFSCLPGGIPEVGEMFDQGTSHIVWTDALNTELLDEKGHYHLVL